MLSKDLESTLNQAFKGARAKRHEFMTVEHLLLALLDNASAIEVLDACGTDLNTLVTFYAIPTIVPSFIFFISASGFATHIIISYNYRISVK